MLLLIGLAFIATFALFAILVDPEDPSEASYDPRSELPFWASLGRH